MNVPHQVHIYTLIHPISLTHSFPENSNCGGISILPEVKSEALNAMLITF